MSLSTATRITLYAISSSALLVLNKICITAVPNAAFLLFIQILSTVVLFVLPALGGYLHINLRPSKNVLRAYSSVALIFLATIYSNFQVIDSVGVNPFIVLRCGTPLVISFLDWVFLNRRLPQGRSLIALMGIFSAGSAYAYLRNHADEGEGLAVRPALGTSGVFWSLVWLSCFVLDMIYIKHIADAFPCNGLERTLYQNVLALPFLIVLLASPIELSHSLRHVNMENGSLLAIFLSCLAGAILSYSGMSLRTELSATAFTVMGIVCKMGSSLLNEIFVSPEPNRASLLCIFGVIISSSFFKQAPLRDLKELPTSSRGISSTRRLQTSLIVFGMFAPLILLNYGARHPRDVSISAMASQTKNLPRKSLWGVITTILEVNPAVVHFVNTFNANLVVIGDKKTNHTEWLQFQDERDNVMYLTPEQQIALGFESLQHIPWDHFGRKSVGFLVAMKFGAEVIYDFDDDNHLNIESFDELNEFRVERLVTDHHVFNPYPYFEAQHEGRDSFVWPRGFPLDFINDEETSVAVVDSNARLATRHQLAVIQSLADHDPDVDAIYRLTRPLPVYFQRRNTLLIPPRGTFIPWNAQAVVLRKPAFFGLLLPVSVTGRVSDIWRSYITSRLLWETEYLVGFSSPVVKQYRNPHSYMKDLEDEKDLYYNVDKLLSTLLAWETDAHQSLQDAYLNLMAKLVSLGFFHERDLELSRAWCKDLKSLGYTWPSISTRLQPTTPREKPVVDERNLIVSVGAPKKNAVCLIGHHAMNNGQALRKHVLDQMDADMFLVLPTGAKHVEIEKDKIISTAHESGLNLETFFDSFAADWRSSPSGNHLGGLPGHNRGHGAFQLRDRWKCEDIISAHEVAHAHKYGYVGVGRADLLWLQPHPQVSPAGCWIPCRTNDWGGLCDHWAWCDRGSAKAYMTAPLLDLPLPNDFGTDINTERHLKFSLEKHKIKIYRGEASFLRTCAEKSSTCTSLQTVHRNGSNAEIFAKHSGEQIESAKVQLLKSALQDSLSI